MEKLTESFENLSTTSKESRDVPGIKGSTYSIVDSVDSLGKCLTELEKSLETKTYLNVDFEGVDLCKTGKVCIGQFSVEGTKHVYLVDFVTLKDPFKECEHRLKKIMESTKTTKVFFDPRNDCDAIFHQFNVQVKNAIDLQVAEVAHRRFNRQLSVKFVFGLKKILEGHLSHAISASEVNSVNDIKQKGVLLFAPERGGSYEVFSDRPLQERIAAYCAVDVLYFDVLRARLFESLTPSLRDRVRLASEKRLVECRKPGYLSKGRQNCIAPQI